MPADPDMLVPLTSARTEFEASVMVEALRAEGIPAKTFALAANMLQWDVAVSQPIKVMVRRSDLEAAAAHLARLRADSVDLDWDEVERLNGQTGEPSDAAGVVARGGEADGTKAAPRVSRWPSRVVGVAAVLAGVSFIVRGDWLLGGAIVAAVVLFGLVFSLANRAAGEG